MKKLRMDAPDLKVRIREKYDAFAGRYDLKLGVMEWMGVARLRRALLSSARGEVLEVAVGTGVNLRHYPAGCLITAIDLSPGMIARARRRAALLGLSVTFYEMDAERLSFPDAQFDTVVSTLSTCTFPNPVAAMSEMGRVTRPGGLILLLEQGYSDRPWVRGWQNWRLQRQFEWLGCRWDREPDIQARQANLSIEADRRHVLGCLHALRLRPGPR